MRSRPLRSFLAPNLLIWDGLGLHRLTPQQATDLYELIMVDSQHRTMSHPLRQNSRMEAAPQDPFLFPRALGVCRPASGTATEMPSTAGSAARVTGVRCWFSKTAIGIHEGKLDGYGRGYFTTLLLC